VIDPAEDITVEQLDELCRALIEEIQADIETYDERAALQARDDQKTTTERAIEALNRPEPFAGEHDVARAWLQNHSTLWIARQYVGRRSA
jgi:hypothetical protein